MDYDVVFDASQKAPDWSFPAFGLIFVALGLLVLRFRDVLPWGWPFRTRPSWRKKWALGFLGFSIFWTGWASYAVFGSYVRVRLALRNNSAMVVEGRVADFHPMPLSGHANETFTVGDVHFAYSDYEVSPGFNQSRSHGGPVGEGLQVRIRYTGPKRRATILKLEVRREQGSSTSDEETR